MRQPRAGVEDLGDPQAEVLVDDDDLAAGDQPAVDQQVGRAAGGAVQLEDVAGGEREQVADGHPGAAELDGHLHVDAVQHLDAALGAVPAAATAVSGWAVRRRLDDGRVGGGRAGGGGDWSGHVGQPASTSSVRHAAAAPAPCSGTTVNGPARCAATSRGRLAGGLGRPPRPRRRRRGRAGRRRPGRGPARAGGERVDQLLADQQRRPARGGPSRSATTAPAKGAGDLRGAGLGAGRRSAGAPTAAPPRPVAAARRRSGVDGRQAGWSSVLLGGAHDQGGERARGPGGGVGEVVSSTATSSGAEAGWLRRMTSPRRARRGRRGRRGWSGGGRRRRPGRGGTGRGSARRRGRAGRARGRRPAPGRRRGPGGGAGRERQADRHPVGPVVDAQLEGRDPITSEAPATWANWGLYSTPAIVRLEVEDVAERVAHLARAGARSGRDDTVLSISVRGRCGWRREPGPPSMWSMQVIAALTGISSTPRPGIGSAEKIVRYVGVERVDVLGVVPLLDGEQATPSRRCAGTR